MSCGFLFACLLAKFLLLVDKVGLYPLKCVLTLSHLFSNHLEMFLLISKGLKVDSVIHEVLQVSVKLIERRSAFVSLVLSKGLEG